MWRQQHSILAKAGVTFVPRQANPFKKLSDSWYAWEIMSFTYNAYTAKKNNDACVAARDALKLGKLIKEFQATWHKVVVHGEKDLDRRSRGGSKSGTPCWRCGEAASGCDCPPWQYAAHKMNAVMRMAASPLTGKRRAAIIVARLLENYSIETVRIEISSRKNRARYPELYVEDPSSPR